MYVHEKIILREDCEKHSLGILQENFEVLRDQITGVSHIERVHSTLENEMEMRRKIDGKLQWQTFGKSLSPKWRNKNKMEDLMLWHNLEASAPACTLRSIRLVQLDKF